MGIFDADPAQPQGFDASYGLSPADKQQMLFSQLGNIGGLLMAAGQKQMPAQRAQYLAQLGNVGGNIQSDIYKAAQAKLMQSQFAEKQGEIRDRETVRRSMGDPAAFKAAHGFDPSGLTPQLAQSIIQQKTVNELTNPQNKELTRMQIEKARRDLATPQTKEVGNDLYELRNGQYEKIVSGTPKGGLDNQAYHVVQQALTNPAVADSPEYAMAHNQIFGPKMVQAFNPDSKQMEYQWVAPPVPQGIPAPRFAQPQPGAPQGQPSGNPAPGMQQGAAPVVPQGGNAPIVSRPPQEEKYTEEQNKAATFSRRMASSLDVINPMDNTPAARPGALEQVIGSKLGDNYVGYLRDADRQKYEQAKRNWVTANLRKESGAVIGDNEMVQETAKYFPLPGEGPEVIAQKRKAREDATLGMLGAAGPAAKRDGLSYKPYEPSMRDKIRAMAPEEVLSLHESYKQNPTSLDSAAKLALLARLKQLNGGR